MDDDEVDLEEEITEEKVLGEDQTNVIENV